MRLGVVSDTHNRLPNIAKIVGLFNEAGVDAVIHTGDIASPEALRGFADLRAPLTGVWGNNDLPRTDLAAAAAHLGFDFHEPPLLLERHSRRLVIVHDPLELQLVAADEAYEVALHGHTHRYRLETLPSPTGDRLIFNPGECAGHMPQLNAVGILDLRTLDTELLRF